MNRELIIKISRSFMDKNTAFGKFGDRAKWFVIMSAGVALLTVLNHDRTLFNPRTAEYIGMAYTFGRLLMDIINPEVPNV